MYVDEIQYTYKTSKLILILSIHENHICILEKPKRLDRNQKLFKLMYVCELEHIKTILSLHKI